MNHQPIREPSAPLTPSQRPADPWVIAHVVGGLLLLSAAGGCSGMPQLTSPIAGYGPSNILSPAGYSASKLSDTHYTVSASGTEATPKERVEKIARARAAQIGVDEKLPYYKVASVRHGFACQKRQAGYKSGDSPPQHRPTVELDVVYAKEPAGDPDYVSSAETFAALAAEIEADSVAPEARAVATQEARSGCGAGAVQATAIAQ